jgi:hypothetical protein
MSEIFSKYLNLVCSKCLRADSFGISLEDQAAGYLSRSARLAGWITRNGRSVCPRCPQTTEERNRRKEAQAAVVHA